MDEQLSLIEAPVDERNDWWTRAWAAVVARARRPGVFEIYTACSEAGVLTAPSPCLWGNLTVALHREGVIARVGYRPGSRPSVSCSAVALWEGGQAVRRD